MTMVSEESNWVLTRFFTISRPGISPSLFPTKLFNSIDKHEHFSYYLAKLLSHAHTSLDGMSNSELVQLVRADLDDIETKW